MAKSRLYGWNGERPAKELSGQAAIVFKGLVANNGEFKTGHAWTDIIGKELATKQDPYRVVLYYILILKSRGVIATREWDIEVTTKTEEGTKHGITVKTASEVDERHVELDETQVAQELETAISEVIDRCSPQPAAVEEPVAELVEG